MIIHLIDGYTTTSTGWSEDDDELAVLAMPSNLDVTRGDAALALVAEDADGTLFTFVAHGWNETAGVLYVTAGILNGASGALTVRCAPTNAINLCLHPAQSFHATLDAVNDSHSAWYGGTHYLAIEAECYIDLGVVREDGTANEPFGAVESGVRNDGHRTTIILTDVYETQPVLNWQPPGMTAISWEDGEAQFSIGKPLMVVEYVGRAGRICAWYREFA